MRLTSALVRLSADRVSLSRSRALALVQTMSPLSLPPPPLVLSVPISVFRSPIAHLNFPAGDEDVGNASFVHRTTKKPSPG